ncbi:DUF1336 domain containing protein, expressed [Seminavis robusta]|uniref:DUF1336 domain containing protein, expressed n=1 Tax=Seminavis robusta TaxID=568900 RepID=A0A9N8H3I5_9STRA|nr:DUF1336 domain containing protein, expressed [Seminavis robusta]|eukprot:Sro27_g018170.1 DUF1336 domain containing protein, expressed (358) ;mRNA; r:84041-85114
MASLLKKVQKKTRQSLSNVSSRAGEHLGKAASKAEEQLQKTRVVVNYDKYLLHPVILEGQFWKRRSGMGAKSRTRAWELRYFELRGSTLLYYGGGDDEGTIEKEGEYEEDTTNATIEGKDQEGPRGHLDFSEEKALVHASLGHPSGAPSPFCLSIVVGISHEQTKWKLCFEDQATLMQWLAVLTNVVVQHSVDGYNVQLLHAANPTNHSNNSATPQGFLRKPRVYEPQQSSSVTSNTTSTHTTVAPSHHQLWLTKDYSLCSTGPKVEARDGAIIISAPDDDNAMIVQAIQRRHRQELEQRDSAYRQQLQDLQHKIVELTMAAADTRAKHNQQVRDLQKEVCDFARIAQRSDDDDDDD